MARHRKAYSNFIVKFGKHRWIVVQEPARAYCVELPSLVFLDPRGGIKDMDSHMHEGLHALLPKASDKAVTRLADGLSDLLWGLGYRRVPQRPKRRKSR